MSLKNQPLQASGSGDNAWRIDYKKELENIARTMILVHDPDQLIKMAAKMIVQKFGVSHASIILNSREKNSYELSVSCGSLSRRVPVGLVALDRENPLVLFFDKHKDRFISEEKGILLREACAMIKDGRLEDSLLRILSGIVYQMEIFESALAVPIRFREELLGILLLGGKGKDCDFSREEKDFFAALVSNVAMAMRNAKLFSELEQELEKKHQLFMRTTIAFSAAIEAKDRYTLGHTTRVTNLSLEIARKLRQKNKGIFSEKFMEDLQVASLLHDIGKIGIPEHILNKRGDLTVGERNRIKEHPLIGTAILTPIKELKSSLLGVKYHHERYDGLGYPEGLKSDQIPLIASIISVADSFDAMSADRSYRPALEKAAAMEEIRRLKGRQFHPVAADALIELYREGKI